MHSTLTVQEAAVLAGVDVRVVNDAIDRKVIPAELLATGDGRRITPEGCLVVSFYNDTSERLTASFRLRAIHRWSKHLIASNRASDDDQSGAALQWSSRIARLLRDPRAVRYVDDGVSVDLHPFAKKIQQAAEELDAAVAMVTQDAAAMGGAPCIRGTRIPVHDVAASLRAGIKLADILEAYPDLTEREVGLADIYARAHPARGRPRRVEEAWPDARPRFEGTVARQPTA